MRKTTELPLEPIPGKNVTTFWFNPVFDFFAVGDCEEIQEDEDVVRKADAVRAKIYTFLNTLRDDIKKVIERSDSELRNSRDLATVNQKLDALKKICLLIRNIDRNLENVEMESLSKPSRELKNKNKFIRSNGNNLNSMWQDYQKKGEMVSSESSDIPSDTYPEC